MAGKLLSDHDKICYLLETIGKIKARANPDGIIAVHLEHIPEQRLAAIWKTIQELEREFGWHESTA